MEVKYKATLVDEQSGRVLLSRKFSIENATFESLTMRVDSEFHLKNMQITGMCTMIEKIHQDCR